MAEKVLERVGQKDFIFEHLHTTSASLGIAPEIFSIPLPASGRFPLRLTAEDIKTGDHLPRINVESLFAHTMHYLPDVITTAARAAGIEIERVGACASHQIIQGSNAALCSMSELPPHLVMDCFETHGFIGSAGIPLTLSLMHPSFLPGMKEVVGLVAFSTGPSWGASFMRMI
jgi:3-oxoacyl-[acyl-carrier-protein] synthase III